MRIEEKPDAIVIETMDVHLPHAFGEALHDAFKGSLQFRYPEESFFDSLRSKWAVGEVRGGRLPLHFYADGERPKQQEC